MLACGPTKATDMLGTHAHNMRQRSTWTCLPRTLPRSLERPWACPCTRERARHAQAIWRARSNVRSATRVTPAARRSTAAMPAQHSPLSSTSSRTATCTVHSQR
eukprot:6454422-Prymnesium_polylepis.1